MWQRERTRKLTTLAVLSALAFLVMAVIKIPVILFLSYEPKDVIITIGGFLYGPLASLMMSVIVSLVEMVTVSSTGYIGAIMNIVSSCAFACTAAFIYKYKRTLGGAAVGLISGVIVTTIVMLLWNYLLTPIFMGQLRADVAKMLIPVFMPFNLLKGGLNAAITMILYKPVRIALSKSRLLPVTGAAAAQPSKINIGALIISAFVIITCVLFILSIQGVI